MDAPFSTILEHLAQGKNLGPDMAEAAFDRLLAGELSESQAGAMLMGLRAKGETADELAAAVRAALAQARLVPGLSGPRIDTCGTGGDNTHSFNCSSAVALFLADLGFQVVKHGNRAVSSCCGSADVYESLGIPLSIEPEAVGPELARRSFVFLFAPAFHPAFAKIAPIRRQLGIRTLFNLMGPLLNPARPTHQILGVGNAAFMDIMAETLLMAGVEKAYVIHGAGGYDELTPFGKNAMVRLMDGRLERRELDPQHLGFPRHTPDQVKVTSKEDALLVFKDVLGGGGPEAARDMVALNLAAALRLLTAAPWSDCVDQARSKAAAGISGGFFHA